MRRLPAGLLRLSALVVGGGSLLLFAWFLVLGPVTAVRFDFGPATALGWDAGLSLLFFAQHSGMVRQSFQRWLQRRVERSAQPAVYAVASGVVLGIVVLGWQPLAPTLWSADEQVWLLLRAIQVLAVGGFAWAVLTLEEFDTFGVKALRDRRHRQATAVPRLAVRGPYRWVRHPLYLGTLLLVWSLPHVTTDRLLFNGLWTCWVVLAAHWEERDLTEVYGAAYLHYRAVVPMLLPLRGPIDEATLQWIERAGERAPQRQEAAR